MHSCMKHNSGINRREIWRGNILKGIKQKPDFFKKPGFFSFSQRALKAYLCVSGSAFDNHHVNNLRFWIQSDGDIQGLLRNPER